MFAFIKKFWVTIGIAGLLIGIFWAPRNILDWEQAAEPWRKIFAMVDRESLLWIVIGLMLVRLIWIDARPFVRQHFTRHQFVAGDVEVRSSYFKVQDETIWRNTYWLPVFNTRNDSRQIKNLRAYIFVVVQWYPSSIGNDKKESIDLNNGERALIHLGFSLSREPLGFPDDEIEALDAKSFLLNAENGHLFFKTDNTMFPVQTAGKSCKPGQYPFFVHVLGEDIKSKMFRIEFSCENFRPTLKVPNKIGEPLEPHTIIGEMTKP